MCHEFSKSCLSLLIAGTVLCGSFQPCYGASKKQPTSDASSGSAKEHLLPADTSWMSRRAESKRIIQLAEVGNEAALEKFIGLLQEFQLRQMRRTPIENMDLLGAHYVQQEGFARSLPDIAMNAVLGWYDALRFGSESGRAELVLKQGFFRQAIVSGWFDGSKIAQKFLRENPDAARAAVEQGISRAETLKDVNSYNHRWPSAFGDEAASGALIQPLDKKLWPEAWEAAKLQVRRMYQSTDKDKNKPTR